MKGELVSVIIPNFNQGKYVLNAIESSLGQTYRDLEVIVIDDSSTDNSVAIIENYLQANPDKSERVQSVKHWLRYQNMFFRRPVPKSK